MAAEERREVSYRYGQLVIGPPGSGKSTYCAGMKQFLTGLGRKVTVVNLDPANHVLPYPCDVNMAELITLDDVMTSLGLGPNGGLLYCMDFLHANIEWLHDKLQSVQDNYLVIDCPGQVELYTHNQSVKEITEMLTKWNIRVCHGGLALCTLSKYSSFATSAKIITLQVHNLNACGTGQTIL